MYFLPAYPVCLSCWPYRLPVLRVCPSCLCRCLFHFSLLPVLCACPAGLFCFRLPFLSGPPVYFTSLSFLSCQLCPVSPTNLSFLSYQCALSVPLAYPFCPISVSCLSHLPVPPVLPGCLSLTEIYCIPIHFLAVPPVFSPH
jgi:hypothetical protein